MSSRRAAPYRTCVSASTRRRYDRCLLNFCDWAEVDVPASGLLPYQSSAAPWWDATLQRYFLELFDEAADDPSPLADGGYSGASVTFAAIADALPELARALPRAKRFLAGWQRGLVISRAPPLPAVAAAAIAGCAWPTDQVFAVCVLLMFSALLRPGELFQLRVEHLSWPQAPAVVDRCSIGLRFLTKTSAAKHAHEHATVHDARVARLLRVVFANAPKKGLLWSRSPHAFRVLFAETITALGLDAFDFRLYSFRRGGATHDFSTHGSWDVACDRGRWKDPATARIYLKDAQALQIIDQFPAPVRARCESFAALIRDMADSHR